MGISKEEAIKELQNRETVFVAYSQATKLPYVKCDEETYNDQAWIFSTEEGIKEFGKKMLEEKVLLKTHIVNYAKTHPVYDAYRKAGYSKKFLDTHREEITLHKVAKAAFDETGLKKLPKVKALNAEYSDLLTQKKAAYPDYRKAREEMQELVKAQKNIELFFAEEKDAQEKQQTR